MLLNQSKSFPFNPILIAQYLTGDNLKVAKAEFSTLSSVLLLHCECMTSMLLPLLELKTRPRDRPVSFTSYLGLPEYSARERQLIPPKR
jgi:hypothetical protein